MSMLTVPRSSLHSNPLQTSKPLALSSPGSPSIILLELRNGNLKHDRYKRKPQNLTVPRNIHERCQPTLQRDLPHPSSRLQIHTKRQETRWKKNKQFKVSKTSLRQRNSRLKWPAAPGSRFTKVKIGPSCSATSGPLLQSSSTPVTKTTKSQVSSWASTSSESLVNRQYGSLTDVA